MFEIYREADYSRQFRVVYFTELNEHNKESEINRAAAGDHYFDGFIAERHKDASKRVLADIVRRLNRGESVMPDDIERQLLSVGQVSA